MMIKIEKVTSHGWAEAVRGMRNPMNSWEKSDSFFDLIYIDFGFYDAYDLSGILHSFYCDEIEKKKIDYGVIIGENDLSLMKSLANAGSSHSKYRRMIIVYMDITAPLYWWKEFDTYKVGTVANSCSTMHKIADKEFKLEDFSCEHLYSDELEFFKELVTRLNSCRALYLDGKRKEDWWQMIQLLPSSYNQKRTVMLNYEVLANIYHDRKNHKLDEWRDFCAVMKDWLPYSELFTYEEDEND